jgi:hypothetical protein
LQIDTFVQFAFLLTFDTVLHGIHTFCWLGLWPMFGRRKGLHAHAAGARLSFTQTGNRVTSPAHPAAPAAAPPSLQPVWDTSAALEALDAMPHAAILALDDWASRVTHVAEDMVGVPVIGDSAVFLRFTQALEFCKHWSVHRESMPSTTHAAENSVIDAFFKMFVLKGWAYSNGCIYTVNVDQFVEDPRPIANVVQDIIVFMSEDVKLYFEGHAALLKRLCATLTDTFVKDRKTLAIHQSRILFANCTAELGSGGIHLMATKPVLDCREQPVVPRAHVLADLKLEEHKDIIWDSEPFVDSVLMPFVGAMLLPPHIRQVDLRPTVLLATGAHPHPLVWALQTFCDLSITTDISTDEDGAISSNDPFVLYMDRRIASLTQEDIVSIRKAMSRNMVVVVHAASETPEALCTESAEYVRMCTVHVHVADPFDNFKNQCDAMVHLLPASQAARLREPVKNQRLLTFLNTPELLRYRLMHKSTRKVAVVLLTEMLQSEMGLEMRTSATTVLASVVGAFEVYQKRRYPDDAAQISCCAEDIIQATQLYKTYFGYVRVVKDVVFAPETLTFVHLHVNL